ncbi:MAG: ABC transporter substrate-binding protein, partial [Gemmatimonadetes bacterium]|nr:ABC transporter substrate-binding protein [Gemmatimonadota bacterium]
CGKKREEASPKQPPEPAPAEPAEYKPRVGARGGRLIISAISNPKSFNPIIAKETSTTSITNYIFEGLTRVSGATNEVEPNLAREWEISEDGLTWTFRLREDVKWNDGKPFTAADVVFTFNDLIYNDDIPTSSRDIFTLEGKPVEVTKIDDYTVAVKTQVKFAPFLRAMTQNIMPKHALEPYLKSGEFNSAFGVDAEPEEIVGTGAFTLQRYEPSQRVLLRRNPHYWRKDEAGESLPYLDGLTILVVPNIDISLLKFQEGETDYYGLRGSDYPILRPQEKEKGFTVFRVGPAFGTSWISFNQNPENNPETGKPFVDPVKLKWFTNVRFRRAVAHAIDRQSMIDLVMNGLAHPQHSSMSPSAGFFYNPNVKKYQFDQQKARQLLADAGFKDRDGDGYIEDSDGAKVEFNLFTNAENNVRVKLCDIVRKDLESVGMQVHFTPLEFNNIVDKLGSTYDWDCILLSFTGGVEPHFGKNVWHSSGQLHEWYPRQKEPATEWEARIDEIFELGVQELDRDKRKELYDEWQTIVSEQLPLIYTVLPESIFAVRNKFGNLYPTPLGGAFHNIEEIYIVK